VNKLFHKFIASIAAAAIIITGNTNAYAGTNVCAPSAIAFGFFNGVQTTDTQASKALVILERLYGTTLPRTGETIRYEKFYNYTNGFEDFVETFEQRLREQEGILAGRYELFLEVMTGTGSWWNSIVSAVTGVQSLLDGVRDALNTRIVANLTALFANPPTSVNYAEHRLRIDNFVVEGKKMVFFAHSQGNLFVNPAAAYAKAQSSAGAVKVVHVAPASPTLSGPHILADKDLVINALRIAGSVPPNTNSIPGFLSRPAGFGGRTDFLGHGLREIYLNPALSISSSVRNLVVSALDEVVAPAEQGSAGFFTATLTWNGAGDVDLHAFEPSGSHVYYAQKTGDTGFLDVDNTSANGPEHYYASCDSDKIQVGNYQIKVANYGQADGRTATVQIASSKDGVIGTRSVVLGEATGNNAVFQMFNIKVSKNTATGQYSVTLQ
jgi:hypothetical protein